MGAKATLQCVTPSGTMGFLLNASVVEHAQRAAPSKMTNTIQSSGIKDMLYDWHKRPKLFKAICLGTVAMRAQEGER